MQKKSHQTEVNKIINQIKKAYQPEKIIIFGSYAYGTPNESSDVDLAVIKETKENFVNRLKKMAKIIRSYLGADILVYTPNEWQEALKRGDYFVEEIAKKGKIVYKK